MKLPRFEYHAPETLEEAVLLKGEHGDEAAILAGGQSLIPLLALRVAAPPMVIDLNRVDALSYVREDGDTLVIGAMTRQRAIERNAGLLHRCPVLADALPLVGHIAIRNRGTVGGSIAHADPAAEWPALALALDGSVEAAGPRGTRTLDAGGFFVTHLTTALAPDEVLTEVKLRLPRGRVGSAFVELARRHGDFALAGAAAVIGLEKGGAVTSARLVMMAVGEVPLRIPEAESALAGAPPTDDRLAEAAAICRRAVSPPGDLHGSSAYRSHLVGVLARRALELARRRVGGAAA